MKQSEIVLLQSYIYNNLCRLEDNVRQIQTQLRFRRVDVADCMELVCALQELETFKEVTGHIRLLLNLDKNGGVENADT